MNKKKINKMGGKLYAICMWTVRVWKKNKKSKKGLKFMYLPIWKRYGVGSSK